MDAGVSICGHNIIKFDLPAIQKLYPDFHYRKKQVFDTLVASRLIYSDLNEVDMGRMKKHPDSRENTGTGSNSRQENLTRKEMSGNSSVRKCWTTVYRMWMSPFPCTGN